MGKHLAPKPKHELNFIKKKPTHASGQTKPVHALRTEKTADTKDVRKSAGRERVKRGFRAAKAKRNAGSEEARRSVPRIRVPETLPSLGRFSRYVPVIAALLLIGIHFVPLEGWMVPAAYAIPGLLAIMDHAADAYEGVRGGRYINNAFLSCLSSVLLFSTGLYTVAVVLLLLSSLSNLFEKHLLDKCAGAQNRISSILPKYATLITESGTDNIDPADVNPGDILLVAAGERIPIDGIVVDGISTIDTAAVSGQRSPWAVNVGYKVYSGCRNLTSDIKIKASRPYQQSTAWKLVRLADAAPDFASEQGSSASRFMLYYQPVVLGLALVFGVVLPIFRGGWAPHLQRAAVMLVAARAVTDCFSIPLLYRKALSLTADFGVFSKGQDCIEAIAKAETIIFDKTGTITEGRYAVTDVYPVKMSEKQLLTIAAAAESFSRHPVAAAIREAAGIIDDRVIRAAKLRDYPGRGISALLGNRQVYVGNAALLEEHGIKYQIPSRPGTAIHVSVDSRYCGYILVTDKVRRRAFDALETLRVNGIKKLVLLTGDVFSVARPIASRLNFDMLRAELKPEEKAKAVNYLMKNKGARSTIAFVGEGENSGRIISGADVGIAMGSLGSDAALASADVLIMDRDIFKIPRTLTISRLVYRAAWENFAVGAGINILLALLGMFGWISPLAAVILSFMSCVALLGNSLRIK